LIYLILSNDTIKKLKPPYQITDEILQLVATISEKIGAINAIHLYKPSIALRKKNRIKSIQSSLEIEGNTLTEEQITALLENKRVVAPKKDILEVQNAIQVYAYLHKFDPKRLKDLEKAHGLLMAGLMEHAGKLRVKNVGIVKGNKIAHVAPNGTLVKGLMNDLFQYLKTDKDLVLIKSCVFHYEFEFIHPFTDGNGRMGRLWQTLLLMQAYPIFEFLPIEHLIKLQQKQYYAKLSESDKKGNATPFVTFMLTIISKALDEVLQTQNKTLQTEDRVQLYKEKIGGNTFSRKDYLLNFKTISAPTASRDLKWATDQKILTKAGKQRLTRYRFL
jgi:Fic family protein